MKSRDMAGKPTVSIEYCTVCNFRSRAVWLAQELLAALEQDVAGITLVPGRGGVFDVRLDSEIVFSQKEAGRFPEPRELKDRLRERLGLDRAPRHS
jgi:selenoprotein W-related protein